MERNDREDIIVIPDVHGRKFWRDAVKKYSENDTIFLGDYLDPYPSEGITPEAAIAEFEELLRYAAEHPNVTLLLGNHDLHYLCNFCESVRMDFPNFARIQRLFAEHLSMFRIATYREIGGRTVVFSHAPILTDWMRAVGETLDVKTLVDKLNAMLPQILDNPKALERYLGYISWYRGGYDVVGSPVWADLREVDESNLIPTADLSIFGHTQLKRDPYIKDRFACLDCRRAFRLTRDLHIQEI